MVPRRILPERFRQALHHHGALEVCDRADPFAHQGHTFLHHIVMRAVGALVQAEEAERATGPSFIRDADHRAFRHVLVRGEDLFHRAGR